ncbi:thiamine phosphate synthase [Furfurilactobacillus sp. WILCCON 0119]|uniref:thiamine phosphate synthase n=1 Tax=Furfurilactobacillus entadae TaxID=2922307 RepID=UPI0035E9CB84
MNFNAKQLTAYFVAGSQDVPAGQTLPDQLAAAIDGGITAFQYREKGPGALTGTARLTLGEQLRAQCQTASIPFFVDDDVDLAQTLHADGIHVGQTDQRIEAVIAAVPDMIIGYSCHTLAQVRTANTLAAVDYIGSGPIFPTQSKADADPAIGLTGLTALVQASRRPIVAIGGLTQANYQAVARTGVAGAAVISLLTQAPNITAAAHDLLETFS